MLAFFHARHQTREKLHTKLLTRGENRQKAAASARPTLKISVYAKK